MYYLNNTTTLVYISAVQVASVRPFPDGLASIRDRQKSASHMRGVGTANRENLIKFARSKASG